MSSVPDPPRPPDAPRRGLGRGLEVLIGGSAQAELQHLPVESIHPNPRQPRKRFEADAISGLAASVEQPGRPAADRRAPARRGRVRDHRRRAPLARVAGGRHPDRAGARARCADDRDTLLLGLVENVARENLSPVEEARAYATLIDEFELSLGEVAARVGRSKPSVSNRVRLLELPRGGAAGCSPAARSPRAMRARCSALPDDDARRRLARRVAKEGLSVRATERAAQEGGARRKPRVASARRPGARRPRARGRRATHRPSRPGARRCARAPLRRRDCAWRSSSRRSSRSPAGAPATPHPIRRTGYRRSSDGEHRPAGGLTCPSPLR